jgi:hypothetical protein
VQREGGVLTRLGLAIGPGEQHPGRAAGDEEARDHSGQHRRQEQQLLRRDQVWFMEEGVDGRRRLYPLLEFSPRRDEALARGYERGRYGAVPLLRTRSVQAGFE